MKSGSFQARVDVNRSCLIWWPPLLRSLYWGQFNWQRRRTAANWRHNGMGAEVVSFMCIYTIPTSSTHTRVVLAEFDIHFPKGYRKQDLLPQCRETEPIETRIYWGCYVVNSTKSNCFVLKLFYGHLEMLIQYEGGFVQDYLIAWLRERVFTVIQILVESQIPIQTCPSILNPSRNFKLDSCVRSLRRICNKSFNLNSLLIILIH